jgi:hypothetical protein
MNLENSDRSVSPFANELRACLSEMLRAPVPEAAETDDPVRFFKHWLAERNLGLVPIDNAAAFDWPGQWIAVFGDDQVEHAMVMFGSPSGVWLDPSNAYHPGARIATGWMLTPLDLHLPTERPYGTAPAAGTVVAILITAHAEAPLSRVDDAEALPGRGLAGDRYAAGRGTFSGPGRGYELTLSNRRCSTRTGSPGNRRAATSSPAASPSTASSANASGSAPSNASAADSPNRAPTSRNSPDPDCSAHSSTAAVSARTSSRAASASLFSLLVPALPGAVVLFASPGGRWENVPPLCARRAKRFHFGGAWILH